MSIEADLQAICNTERGPYLRPFRPNPEWASATVFIVGTNPATPLREQFRSFDEYWDSLTKHPEIFERAYGMARDGSDSKTTTRVKALCAHLRGINYLVTNAAAYPVAHNEKVPAEQWKVGERIFRMLLTQCAPRAVFAHGSKAQGLVERVFGEPLDPYADPGWQNQRKDECLLLCAPHLSGAGMKPGATFSVCTALPQFARRIREAAA